MRVRKLDANGDMQFGRGQADFYRDVPEAPAQCVQTRLWLRLGEWFLDTSDGTPWDTEILGKNTANTRDAALRSRIEGTTGVTSLDTYNSTFNPDTRTFSVEASISTSYGTASVFYTSDDPAKARQLAADAVIAGDMQSRNDANSGALDFSNPYQSGWL